MNHLADAVLDYYLFLYFAEEHSFASTRAIKLAELYEKTENQFSDSEKQALKEAAKRRLPKNYEEVYAADSVAHFPTELDRNLFLQDVVQGLFDIPSFDDIRDPDEEPLFE